MRGIDDTVDGSPTRQFLSSRLPACYLLQRIRHIHFRILTTLKCQLTDVCLHVLPDKVECSLICLSHIDGKDTKKKRNGEEIVDKSLLFVRF